MKARMAQRQMAGPDLLRKWRVPSSAVAAELKDLMHEMEVTQRHLAKLCSRAQAGLFRAQERSATIAAKCEEMAMLR